jgi:hemerythrin
MRHRPPLLILKPGGEDQIQAPERPGALLRRTPALAILWSVHPLQWSDQFKTGIASIDRDHLELFGQIQKLSEATANASSRDVVANLLEFLTDYTRHHFSKEENLMRRADYPRVEEHRLAHEQMMLRVTEMVRDFQSPSQTDPQRIGEFLSNWWSDHVLNEDFAFVPWVEALPKNG